MKDDTRARIGRRPSAWHERPQMTPTPPPVIRSARRWIPLALAGLTLAVGSGCAKTITFYVDDYINTGMHINRAPEDRTGEPLELAIVCVTPGDTDDKEHAENARLKPYSGITADEWFNRQPRAEDRMDREGGETFRLPPSQVYLFTDDPGKFAGQRLGPALVGAKQMKGSPVKKARDIEFSMWSYGDKESVIYIFPKFVGPQGEVLPVSPIMLNPPGDYPSTLDVKIGVRSGAAHYGQYIELLDDGAGASSSAGAGGG